MQCKQGMGMESNRREVCIAEHEQACRWFGALANQCMAILLFFRVAHGRALAGGTLLEGGCQSGGLPQWCGRSLYKFCHGECHCSSELHSFGSVGASRSFIFRT